MTFENIVQELASWGQILQGRHYEGFREYFYKMLGKKRVMFFWNDDNLEAVLFFFLTNDYETLYKKGLWDVPDDEPEGHQLYGDKLICKRFTLSLRRKIQYAVEDTFPSVEEGYYHRAPFDRCVKIKRRKVRV